MRSQDSISEVPFKIETLKKSIQQAKEQLVDAYQDNENNLFRFFVAKNSFESKIEQPIDIVELSTSTKDIFYQLELYPLQKRLTDIQRVVGVNLRTIIGGANSGSEPTDVSILAETPQYYILYDKLDILQECLQIEYNIPYTVLSTHRIRAKQILNQLDCDLPPEDATVWVIQKPSHWYDGQWAVTQTLSHFLQCGMSPTEALDYWMVSVMNAPVYYWARIRGKTNESIYNQLRKATKKIELYTHPDTAKNFKFTERTYEGNKIEGTEYITVDNGFLQPRRDVMNPSVSGKMKSGYKGAGPKQLAVAILADLFGHEQAEELAHELHGQIQHLATIDEDGNWRLSEERLQQWYWNQ